MSPTDFFTILTALLSLPSIFQEKTEQVGAEEVKGGRGEATED